MNRMMERSKRKKDTISREENSKNKSVRTKSTDIQFSYKTRRKDQKEESFSASLKREKEVVSTSSERK